MKILTVVQRANSDWTVRDMEKLATGLCVSVAGDVRHRTSLILNGNFELEQITSIVGVASIQKIEGKYNPRLPFRPRF